MVFKRGTQRGDFLEGSGTADSIYGMDGDDRLLGLGGHDYLNGGRGDDTLEGGQGNDVLDGTDGNDRMLGGPDNDIYYVNDVGDTVIERAGEGLDTVFSTLSRYTLPNHVENGVANGFWHNGNMSITGNSLDNKLTTRRGRGVSFFILEGKGGDDTLLGSSLQDLLFGGDDDDLIRGRSGDDWVDGGNGNDRLHGDAGKDTISGFASNHSDIDQMWGGADADVFALGWSNSRGNRIHYSQGRGYAIIQDFNSREDKIQLAGELDRSDYRLGTGNWNGGNRDTGVYYKNDLIAVISNHAWIGQNQANLNADYFKYDDA